jgi:amino acid adenylation domain-containing protein
MHESRFEYFKQLKPSKSQDKPEYFPLSFAQEQLWFLDALGAGSTYNITLPLMLKGRLNRKALENALKQTINRHDSLRAVFVEKDGLLAQRISEHSSVRLAFVNLGETSEQDRFGLALRLASDLARNAFDLSTGPLVRAILLKLDDQSHVFALTVPEIVCDTRSLNVLMRDLGEFYDAFSRDLPLQVSPSPRYIDFVLWEREWLRDEIFEGQVAYWKNRLNESAPLQLPTDFQRQAIRTFRGATRHVVIEKGLADELAALGEGEAVHPSTIFLAAFQVMLGRYTRQDDISVGVPVNRYRDRSADAVGCFINTLVIRNKLNSDSSFREMLVGLQKLIDEAYEHRYLPFSKLVKAIHPDRDSAAVPLFQVLFVYQDGQPSAFGASGLEMTPLEIHNSTAQFDLSLYAVQVGDGVRLEFEYNTDLFVGQTIDRMLGHLDLILARIASHADHPISSFPLLNEPERSRLLVEWNGRQANVDCSSCLHQLFEGQVERRPSDVAVTVEGDEISYLELNRRANKIAHHLLKLGLSLEHAAGICMEPSIDAVAAIIGISKAGGAFVPLDIATPHDQLAFQISDTRTSVILTQERVAGRLPSESARVICLDRDWEVIDRERDTNPEVAVSLDNLCAIFYTSGSTGVPKGVMTTHAVALGRSLIGKDVFELGEDDRFLQHEGFIFATSMTQVYLPLASGGRLIIAPPDGELDTSYIAKLISDHGITVIGFTPSLMRVFLNEQEFSGTTLKHVFCSAEGLPSDLQNLFFQKVDAGLHKFYGLTEAPGAAYWRCRPEDDWVNLTIGRPLDNTVYILDDHLQPVPLGMPGEIYTTGGNLTRGYLNRPDLTAERYIPNPLGDEPGSRLYKTGDLARWLPDGVIEFIGRVDHQVNLHGYRVELGEIETALAQHPNVEQVAVVESLDSDQKKLVAYLVTRNGAEVSHGELRGFLKESLPDYKIPSLFIKLETLPLLPNGKINRRALPSPDRDRVESARQFMAARSPFERALAEIWREVLKLDQVSVLDNFFELGGDSFLSIHIVNKAKRVGINISPRQIFERQTIAELAEAARAVQPAKSEPQATTPDVFPDLDMKKVAALLGDESNVEDAYPLSPIQEGMLFHNLYSPEAGVYTGQFICNLSGDIDIDAFKKSWRRVIDRHEILRTAFVWEGLEKPLQVVCKSADLPIERQDWRAVPPGEWADCFEAFLDADLRRGIDISAAPLMRLTLIRLGPNSYRLVWSHHHLLLDGWCFAPLLKEVFAFYDAFLCAEDLSLKKSRPYRDYIAWLRQQDLPKAEAYWREQLKGFVAPTRLAFGKLVNDSEVTTDYARREMSLSEEETGRLKSVARQHRLTLNSILQGVWALLLNRYSGEADVLFGATVSGRPVTLDGSESMIGLFINTLPIRVLVDAKASVIPWLKEIQNQLADIRLYEYSPLVEVQGWSEIPRNLPMFETILVFQNYNADTSAARLSERVEVSDVSMLDTANYPLSVLAIPGAQFKLKVLFDCNRFDGSAIERMLGHLKNLLLGIVENHDRRLNELPMLSEQELALLLFKWNDTRADYPGRASIAELFEAQVERTPGAVAVSFEGEQLSYRELNKRANQLARYLRELGVGPEVMVGVCMEQSMEMVIAMLGILKAGGAYVPLDPSYPLNRLTAMMESAWIPVVLTRDLEVDRLPALPYQAILLDEEWDEISARDESNPAREVGGENLAYVIYTSGSSGKPKGTCVEHRAITRLVINTNYIKLTEEDRVAQVSNTSFDALTFEVWGALLNGGRLVLIRKDAVLSSEDFGDRLKDEHITSMFLTTSLFNKVARENPTAFGEMENLLVGGEAVDPKSMREVLKVGRPRRLLNAYGPTETTTFAAWEEVDHVPEDALSIPIGRPLANAQLYLLGATLEPVPVGLEGELYIGGDGLARGYLGLADLTAEKFIPHPYAKRPGERLYKTGDRCRYREDGKVEFLGRVDNQVKVRGFRIEPEDIEAAINELGSVKQAAALTWQGEDGDKRLVAYVVPKDGAVLSGGDLRERLKNKLPDYMIPSQFICVAEIPLTPNGKLDRRALPSPGSVERDGADVFAEPRTMVEQLIAGIWSEVLKAERVSTSDNFFELGGHSLLATQVVSRMRDIFKVKVKLSHVFESPTMGALAEIVEQILRSEERLEVPPIKPAQRDRDLPLSFAQQRLWFLEQFDKGDAVYNVPIILRLTGGLDVPALEQSFKEIVRRHEVLRTNFVSKDGWAVQQINTPDLPPPPVIDLSEIADGDRLSQALLLAKAESITRFDLANDPLLRIKLLRLSEGDHVLVVVIHHIISDGWSMGILTRELAALYDACRFDAPSPLQDLAIQYADFACWQREWLQGEVLDEQLTYWKQQLGGELPVLQLPADRPRPAIQSQAGKMLPLELSEGLTGDLKSLARRQGATLFMTMLAAYKALLYRYTEQEDILVGTPIANRNKAEIEPLIGFFVNTLVMRTDLSGNPSFSDLIKREREVSLAAYAHQDLPFELLVEHLHPDRRISHSPLFQVFFVLQNAPMGTFSFGGLKTSVLNVERTVATFDLTLGMVEQGEKFVGAFEYNTDLFDDVTIERLAGNFERLLQNVVNESQRPVASLTLMSESEKQQLIFEWNDTKSDYPEAETTHELFERQVERTPDAIAIVSDGGRMSYRELNLRANRLAHFIARRRTGPGPLVGICLERSPEMIIGLLAILKSGAAYLPLDPAYPKERLAFLLDDAKPGLLITDRRLAEALPLCPAEIICLDADRIAIRSEGADNPRNGAYRGSLAYVIYTSGSTGRPKGVMICHRALCNHLIWLASEFPLHESNSLLQKSSLSFDQSVLEIFYPLICGATLVQARPGGEKDVQYIIDLIDEQKVTAFEAVPSMLRAMIEEDSARRCSCLRRVTCGGEVLSVELKEKIFDWLGDIELANMYGPTETTIGATFYRCQRALSQHNVPIGGPVFNTQLHILSEFLELSPVGVPGEIYIGGDGVAWGYLNRPDLTAEKFIPNPFARTPGERLYRSGDRGRYLADGNVEFLGRKDEQVKIRGVRIEPGEIEASLNEHPAIQQTVVVAKEDSSGGIRLIACVVPAQQNAIAIDELRGYLRLRLPEHLSVSSFLILESLPLAPGGKVDRRALINMAAEMSGGEETFTLRTPVEEVLAGIWSEVLKLDRVNPAESFFNLGGHSLLATQLISRVKNAFGVGMPVSSLFEEPTVRGFAAMIEKQIKAGQTDSLQPILPTPEQPDYPLSFAQYRLWFLNELEPESSAYNMPLALRLTGDLNMSALQKSFDEIRRRHEILRATFVVSDGKPRQVISAFRPEAIPVVDLEALPPSETERQMRRLVNAESRRPFDLYAGPLMRTLLLKLSESDHVLVFTIQHIVSDGWSIGILTKELQLLYEAFCENKPSPLQELPIQYRDFAHWQQQLLEGRVLESQLTYWKERLANTPPMLDLPTDRPRTATRSSQGAGHAYAIDEDTTEALKRLSKKESVTLYMILLAAFKLLLHRYTGQAVISVGAPTAGRNQSEIEHLIGFFVNTLILQTDLSGDLSFRRLLARVRETAIGAYANQDIPFERLVEALQPERSLRHTPLFQVWFNMVSYADDAKTCELGPLAVENFAFTDVNAKFDISLYIREEDDGIKIFLVYKTDLFEHVRMVEMLEQFGHLLSQVVDNPDELITEFSLVTPRASPLLPDPGLEFDGDLEEDVFATFANRVRLNPHKLAVRDIHVELTYAELYSRSNRLANYLIANGVSRGDVVGIYAGRNAALVCAMLGVMRAGAAFVILDPAYPESRLIECMRIAEISCWLRVETNRPIPQKIGQYVASNIRHALDLPRLPADEGKGFLSDHSAQEPALKVNPDDRAYIAFTSGSTGVPKGIIGTHAPLTHFLIWYSQEFEVDESDRFGMLSGISHDPLLRDIFAPLWLGATLCIPDQGTLLSDDLFDWIGQEEITVLHLTPAMSHLLNQSFKERESAGLTLTKVRYVFFGGDALTVRDAASIRKFVPSATRVNFYGTTETPQAIAYHVMAEDLNAAGYDDAEGFRQPVPLGKGIRDVQLLVLNSSNRLAGISELGEICVRTPYLSKGYIDDERLTRERFVVNPYTNMANDLVYKTGDLGRYLPTGEVEFVGRADSQVKVRGFRMELSEIQHAIEKYRGVRKAVVALVTGANDDKHLAAYIVSDVAVDLDDLRLFIRERLPEYMVPSGFVILDKLPLTPNGKVDFRALAEIERSRKESTAQLLNPRDAVELQLLRIWQDMLPSRLINIRDNFFDLGGTSILAVSLMARIERVFAARLPLAALFKAPDIERLAIMLRKQVRFDSETPLVEIQPRGSKLPFFCVHGAGGTVLTFAGLAAHLGPDQPFYGLQSVAVNGGRKPTASIEAMAAHYIRSIRTVRPEGPYLLGGYSMGAVIAFEMAQQLMSEGGQVALLVLIDPPAITDRPARQGRGEIDEAEMIAGMLGEFAQVSVDDVRRQSHREQLNYALEVLKSRGAIPPDVGADRLRHYLSIYRNNVYARRDYVPKPYANRVCLLRAADSHQQKDQPVTSGWEDLAHGGIEAEIIPGSHDALTNGGAVRVLAERLRELIDKAQALTTQCATPDAG